MATRKSALSAGQTNASTERSVWKDGGQAFYIRKNDLELKVTLQGKSGAVAVSPFNKATRSVAEGVARVQEDLLKRDLEKYKGHHPLAYLLALYNDQGCLIKTDDNAVPFEDANDGSEKHAEGHEH